ncbi:MAG: ureidoglycolate lyase [Tagaea sp.]|nr:ureidoglycolate lyase [Tagaea sp.]
MSALRAEPLTETEFAPFGFVRALPRDGARVGPFAPFADDRPGARVTTTLIDLPPQTAPRKIAMVERHLHSAQFFLPLTPGNMTLVVMPTATDGGPDIANARAFVAAAGQAFGYRPGTWHAGVAAAGGGAAVASLLSRAGTQDDVEERALAVPLSVTWP